MQLFRLQFLFFCLVLTIILLVQTDKHVKSLRQKQDKNVEESWLILSLYLIVSFLFDEVVIIICQSTTIRVCVWGGVGWGGGGGGAGLESE